MRFPQLSVRTTTLRTALLDYCRAAVSCEVCSYEGHPRCPCKAPVETCGCCYSNDVGPIRYLKEIDCQVSDGWGSPCSPSESLGMRFPVLSSAASCHRWLAIEHGIEQLVDDRELVACQPSPVRAPLH